MNSSDIFNNLIHQFFNEFFSVWAVENENKFLVCPKWLFFLLAFLNKKWHDYKIALPKQLIWMVIQCTLPLQTGCPKSSLKVLVEHLFYLLFELIHLYNILVKLKDVLLCTMNIHLHCRFNRSIINQGQISRKQWYKI